MYLWMRNSISENKRKTKASLGTIKSMGVAQQAWARPQFKCP